MILSIDPGNTGAIAELDAAGQLIRVHDMPVVDGYINAPLLKQLVHGGMIDRVILEQARSMPGQGVASTFKYGTGYGIVLGVLVDHPIEIVTASKWKQAMHLPGKDKEASRQRAIAEWPTQAGLFARKKDHNRAEAALLGLWWLQNGRQPRLDA